MITLNQLYQDCRKRLRAGGVDTPDLDARLLVAHALKVQVDDIVLNPDMLVEPSGIEPLVDARLQGRPVAKIIGLRGFFGFDFIVNDDVLDPRPDTEILVQAALEMAPSDARILDVCTGSGCIAISLLNHLPNAKAVATDISDKALAVALQNAAKHGVAGRIAFKQTSFMDGVDELFDVITCNPPYICRDVIESLQRDVKNYDPMLALDGGEDGLDPYRIIFPQIRARLKTGGKALFEMGYDQAESLTQMANNYGLDVHGVLRDYGGNDRVIIVS